MNDEPLLDLGPMDLELDRALEDVIDLIPLPPLPQNARAKAGGVMVIDTPEEVTLTINDDALVIATPQHVSALRWLPYSDMRTFRILPFETRGEGMVSTRYLILTEENRERPRPVACLDSQDKAETVIRLIRAGIESHVASKNDRMDPFVMGEAVPKSRSLIMRALAGAGIIVLGIGILCLLAFVIPYMHNLANRY